MKRPPPARPLEDPNAADPERPARRTFLRWCAGASLVPLAAMLGCGGGGGADGVATSGGVTESVFGGWAAGGTAAMTAKASYPDPFEGGFGSPCSVVAATTEGPCTTALILDREDVSEGWGGLPVRLVLKVVNASCTPLAGLTVKIWHTNFEGSYSGQTPNNGMCLTQADYSASDFFRGVQVTDADGVVAFDTCFPGWYRGRAVHVHFQVSDLVTTYKVSQLFFPEAVTQDVFASHAAYAMFGQPDTVFSNDNIMAGIPAAEWEKHVLAVSRMTDGAMLASKVVSIA